MAGSDGEEGPSKTGPMKSYGQGDTSQAYQVFNPTKGERSSGGSASEVTGNPSHFFEQALEQTRMAITITDPHAHDNPIIFVNKAFEVLTGYDRDEILGRNCRFLQTSRPNHDELQRLRTAMEEQRTVVVELENERKDGTRFLNALHVGPIFGDEGNLTHFYGSQWDLSELETEKAEVVRRTAITEELQHRIGNLFSVISSILRLSGRDETDVPTVIDKANDRILALARAHQVTVRRFGAQGDIADLHDLVDTVLRPYRSESDARIMVGGENVSLPGHAVTPMGLALHELATNAIKYGALARSNGKVGVEWTVEGGNLTLTWQEEGGDPVSEAPTGTGTRILQGMLASAGGSIETDWKPEGVQVTIAFPMDPNSR